MSHILSILEAVDKYAEQTGVNLKENPFADKVKGCDSPDAILLLLQENMNAFKDYRDKNRKFIDCLSPVVQVVHAFSGILGEVAGLVSHGQSLRSLFLSLFPHQVPFQPAKLIFVGINILFSVRVLLIHWQSPPDIRRSQAADGVSASYDALLELFECIGNFLKRLHIYTEIPLDLLMKDIVTKIMVELISILALAKKQISRGRLSKQGLTIIIADFL